MKVDIQFYGGVYLLSIHIASHQHAGLTHLLNQGGLADLARACHDLNKPARFFKTARKNGELGTLVAHITIYSAR